MHPDMLRVRIEKLGLWVARLDFIAKNRSVLTDFLEDYLRMVRPQSTFDTWLFTKKDYYRDPAGRIDVVAL
jgi:hypothetical protein